MKYMSVVILHIAHMFNFCTQKCTLKIEYGAVLAVENIELGSRAYIFLHTDEQRNYLNNILEISRVLFWYRKITGRNRCEWN